MDNAANKLILSSRGLFLLFVVGKRRYHVKRNSIKYS